MYMVRISMNGVCVCVCVCMCLRVCNICTLLQAGVNDKVSHDLAGKILIEMGEFFQIQVSH